MAAWPDSQNRPDGLIPVQSFEKDEESQIVSEGSEAFRMRLTELSIVPRRPETFEWATDRECSQLQKRQTCMSITWDENPRNSDC